MVGGVLEILSLMFFVISSGTIFIGSCAIRLALFILLCPNM